jgi:hypothetical protein
MMTDVRIRSGAERPPSSPGSIAGARDSRLSRYCLWWVVAAPFVGLVLAEILNLGAEGDWEFWKAAALGALMMAPFAVGAYLGLRAVLRGFRAGWVGFAANLLLGVLAIGMPISESLVG